jgi:plasmid stability protein
MTKLIIRNIDPKLRRIIRDLAKQSGRTFSAEALSLLRRGVSSDHRVNMGDRMYYTLDDEHRGDDLVFEFPDVPPREPPNFE